MTAGSESLLTSWPKRMKGEISHYGVSCVQSPAPTKVEPLVYGVSEASYVTAMLSLGTL